MNRHLSSRAIGRVRWFAELSAALGDGERTLSKLIAEGISPADTERLRLHLIELRAEVVRLNRVSLIDSRIVGSAWPDQATKRRPSL
jgi:hypothetical protein